MTSNDEDDNNTSKDVSFEKNLMPKLMEEYKANDMKKIPFDKEKIKRKREDGGFGIRAWDNVFLQHRIDILVYKGLIEDLGGGEYQISDLGIQKYS